MQSKSQNRLETLPEITKHDRQNLITNFHTAGTKDEASFVLLEKPVTLY